MLCFRIILQPETDIYSTIILHLFIALPSYVISVTTGLRVTEAHAPLFYIGLLCSTFNPIVQMHTNPHIKNSKKKYITYWTGIKFGSSVLSLPTDKVKKKPASATPTEHKKEISNVPMPIKSSPYVDENLDKIRTTAFNYFALASRRVPGKPSQNTVRNSSIAKSSVHLTNPKQKPNAAPRHDLLDYMESLLDDFKF